MKKKRGALTPPLPVHRPPEVGSVGSAKPLPLDDSRDWRIVHIVTGDEWEGLRTGVGGELEILPRRRMLVQRCSVRRREMKITDWRIVQKLATPKPVGTVSGTGADWKLYLFGIAWGSC